MNTGERLASLAGASGTASSLLSLIGNGATTGFALVDYSGLGSDTALNHLLADIAPTQVIASLGGVAHEIKHKSNPVLIEDDVSEPIPLETINRIRNEFLSESLTHDLIRRARVRKSRAEEEALLLMF